MPTVCLLLICSSISTPTFAQSALAQSAAEGRKLQHFDPQQADRFLDPRLAVPQSAKIHSIPLLAPPPLQLPVAALQAQTPRKPPCVS